MNDRIIRNICPQCLYQVRKEKEKPIWNKDGVKLYWDFNSSGMTQKDVKLLKKTLAFKLRTKEELAELYTVPVETIDWLIENKKLEPFMKLDDERHNLLFWLPDAMAALLEYENSRKEGEPRL